MGFLGKQMAISVFDVDWSSYTEETLAEKLKTNAFDADLAGTISLKLHYGWVDFNDMSTPLRTVLNVDGYWFFSVRYDTRTPNAARVKMLLNEAMATAEREGRRVKKSDLREQIVMKELTTTPWTPHIFDMCYDDNKKRLYVGTQNQKSLNMLEYMFMHTFGENNTDILPAPTTNPVEMCNALAASLNGEHESLQQLTGLVGVECDPEGTITYKYGDKSRVTAISSVQAGKAALENNYQISKATIHCTGPQDFDISADVDTYGQICRIVFPKYDKNTRDVEDAVLFINASLVSYLADMLYAQFDELEDVDPDVKKLAADPGVVAAANKVLDLAEKGGYSISINGEKLTE